MSVKPGQVHTWPDCGCGDPFVSVFQSAPYRNLWDAPRSAPGGVDCQVNETRPFDRSGRALAETTTDPATSDTSPLTGPAGAKESDP